MRAYDVAIADVAKALKEQNVELPAGSVNAGATELSVRTLGRWSIPLSSTKSPLRAAGHT